MMHDKCELQRQKRWFILHIALNFFFASVIDCMWFSIKSMWMNESNGKATKMSTSFDLHIYLTIAYITAIQLLSSSFQIWFQSIIYWFFVLSSGKSVVFRFFFISLVAKSASTKIITSKTIKNRIKRCTNFFLARLLAGGNQFLILNFWAPRFKV